MSAVPAYKTEFWDAFTNLVILGDNQRIAFTAEGKRRLRPQLARAGFVLENIRTQDQFEVAMRAVYAQEMDDNTQQLMAALDDPRTTDVERELIREILGLDKLEQPVIVKEADGNVIKVDFRHGK